MRVSVERYRGHIRYALSDDIYEFFMGPLRHFYGFCLSIDLLLWAKHQHGPRAKNSLNVRGSWRANPRYTLE